MPNNNQFRAIPSTSSRALDISSSNTQIEDSNNKFPTRDCSSNSTSTTTEDNSSEPVDYQYEDGALEETDETESYSNLDLNTVKLFVGQIPYSYSEDNLYPLFSQFGPVAEIVVIRDRFTFKSRGCAFVSFRNKQDADTCIRELNQRLKLPPLNTPLRVKYAYTEQQLDNLNDNFVNNAPNLTTSSSPNDSNSEKSQDLTIASNFLSCLNIDKYEIGVPHPENKLFIRNIPKSVTEDELSSLFESFGEILDVVVLRTTIHTSKGCGFIKFTNPESAEMVINTFKREIMTPIQEYQQGAQQEGTTLGGPSNQRLVELTNKLLESSFLMKGAITPLLVRYADNDYAPNQSQDEQQLTQQYSVSNHEANGNGYHPRRRKSYPFAQHNRRGSHHYQQAQHYYQNPYYDHTNGYGSMYPPNYYGYHGQGQDGVSTPTDTVYFYHLYNNPYGATTTAGTPTTTTITAPTETIGNTNGYVNHEGKTANSENGPSPVPPMYYYYPPYYYHPQYANTTTTATASNVTSNHGGSAGGINNGNSSHHNYHHQQQYYNHQTNKYSSSHNNNNNNNYVNKNNKYKSSSNNNGKHVTKCSDA